MRSIILKLRNYTLHKSNSMCIEENTRKQITKGYISTVCQPKVISSVLSLKDLESLELQITYRSLYSLLMVKVVAKVNLDRIIHLLCLRLQLCFGLSLALGCLFIAWSCFFVVRTGESIRYFDCTIWKLWHLCSSTSTIFVLLTAVLHVLPNDIQMKITIWNHKSTILQSISQLTATLWRNSQIMFVPPDQIKMHVVQTTGGALIYQ